MGSPELKRKVRQHDNDLAAIYEIVAGHSDDLIEIKATLAEHGSKLAEHGSKLDAQGAKLDAQGAKLDAQGAKLDAQGAKLAEVDWKLDHLSSTVVEQGTKLDELLALLRGRTE